MSPSRTIPTLFASFFFLALVAGLAVTAKAQGTDTTKPVSAVSALAQRQTAKSFTVTVTGSDPGSPSSGVATYDIYTSVNGGTYALWTTATAGSPSAVYTGQSNTTYAFHSIAHDVAGNTETKSSTLLEASTFVPDLDPPVSSVTSVTHATSAFRVNWSGNDVGGGSIYGVAIYAVVDGGAPQLVGSYNLGAASGTSGYFPYQALADGSSHTYQFYTIATDNARIAEAAPAAPYDASVTATFPVPATVKPGSFYLQRGNVKTGGTYIRYVDITFPSTPPSVSRLRLKRFSLNGTGGTIIPISGVATTAGNVITLDFGATGITGAASTSAGDGYYELGFDAQGIGRFGQVYHFYRLLGDVNGDSIVDDTDINNITARLNSSGVLPEDVNGDGIINSSDKTIASRLKTRRVLSALRLDTMNQ